MPSLDFVYDFAEKLDKDKLDYFVVVFETSQKKGKKDEIVCKANLFYNLADDDAKAVAVRAIKEFLKKLK